MFILMLHSPYLIQSQDRLTAIHEYFNLGYWLGRDFIKINIKLNKYNIKYYIYQTSRCAYISKIVNIGSIFLLNYISLRYNEQAYSELTRVEFYHSRLTIVYWVKLVL